jgi:O-methyltransferase
VFKLSDRGIIKPEFDLRQLHTEYHDISDNLLFWDIVHSVYDYTELSIAALFNLFTAVEYVIKSDIKGDIVECGVHLGGSIMAIEIALMKLASNPQQKVYALDTFGGFLRRSDKLDINLKTGAPACLIESDSTDYTSGSTDNMKSVGYEGLIIVKGDVLETIPQLNVNKIAILRLDTDTYDTTKFELENLYHYVSPGGVIIIDDYGYTRGCKKAVDDFISGKQIFLNRINANVRSWIKT